MFSRIKLRVSSESSFLASERRHKPGKTTSSRGAWESGRLVTVQYCCAGLAVSETPTVLGRALKLRSACGLSKIQAQSNLQD